ncbi:protein kinase [Flavobacterium sp. KMS]|uniref:protein kinase domain-containing protein n=1 Tax=Flavobacterium sp. KMS TaxID=1566023 RepID=UPI00068F1914|nr:protein kinase [Flavobacterium sp. KMS]
MIITERIENIDNGGFGIVDKVLCDDGKHYARKTFSMNIPHDKELKKNALERFKREANYQASFEHRNIVPILFKDLEAEEPYYIMPLAEKVLKKLTLNGKDEIFPMLLDVMSGLEEMHNKSYYHRDLKPGNILRFIDEEGECFYAIGDFGLLSINQTNITELTPISMIKGSDYYTAPEIVASLARASIQSDIFSLGCLIHDYFGKTSRIPCQPIIEDGAIGKIMGNCTHKKVIRRFKSVEFLREALISISHEDIEIKSEEGSKLVNLVDSEQKITYEDWEKIIDFVSNDKNASEDIGTLFKKIGLERIDEIIKLDLTLADALGYSFSEWVRERAFLFDYCDIIGKRLDKFIEHCSLNTKTPCIIALLIMGTSHNRFYVEELCYKWMHNAIDNTLAQRLAIELISEDKTICYKINHLERSIKVDRYNFHPLVLESINKLCK